MSIIASLRDTQKLSYITAQNGKVTEIAQSFTDMLGYTAGELLHKTIDEVFTTLRLGPDWDIQNIDEKADYFLFSKTLEVRFVNIKVIKKMDEQIYVLTELPNTRFDEKFGYLHQLLFNNVTGIAIYSVPDLIMLKTNQKYLDFLGTPYNCLQKTIGRQVYEFFPDWEGSPVEELWRKVIVTGEPEYVKELRFDMASKGITYWDLIITPLKENGRIKYLVTNPQDVTERVVNREKLQQQAKDFDSKNRQLEAIIESIQDNVSILDSQGRYLRKSSEIKRSFEPTEKDIWSVAEKTQFFDMEGNLYPVEELGGHRLIRGLGTKNQRLKLFIGGREKYLQFTGVPIFNENNELEMGVLFAMDISEQVMQDKALKYHQEIALKAERERNEALEKAITMKDEFLSLLSHEFKTPITIIDTAIQAMNYFCWDELPQKAKEYIATIRRNTFRQLRLVNNLLDIIRINAGSIKIHKKNTDIVFLTKAITESVNTYAFQKGIGLSFETRLEKKIIGIDEEKYERILLNLLSNAIKFTPEGKTIIVKLRAVKGSICIDVKDNGIGIPQDKVSVIFEKFGQVDSSLSRQAEGTGIGLSLVKKFVEVLGGSISVKSKVGRGSTFTVMLPNEKAFAEYNEKPLLDTRNNSLVQITNVEFSDIYL